MKLNYIDIGVNLFDKQFKNKEDEIAKNSLDKKIGMIITGCSERSSGLASEYSKEKEGIWSTVGVHPHSARFCNDKTIEKLKNMALENPNVVAIGECGLDYDRMFSLKNEQTFWFERQIELAEELNMPLFLHERSAADDFYKIMKRHKKICPNSVVHCYTGDKGTVLRYLNLGCFIGITGWVCDDKRNKELLDALTVIPVERMMIETDAPYLTPRNLNLDRVNIPENIVYVAEKVAELKNMDVNEFIQIVYDNTINFFHLRKENV